MNIFQPALGHKFSSISIYFQIFGVVDAQYKTPKQPKDQQLWEIKSIAEMFNYGSIPFRTLNVNIYNYYFHGHG